MKVTNCRNCPFRVSLFNDWSFSFDSVDECALHNNSKLTGLQEEQSKVFIRQYNDFEDNPDQNIPSPDWCPLKKIGDINIQFTFE